MPITDITASMSSYRAGSNAAVSALSRIRGATPKPVFTAVGHSANVVWSDGTAGGSFVLSGTNNSIATYTPKNKTQAVTITANQGAIITEPLTVIATFPLFPQIGYEIELDIETKIKYARDRTRYSREEGKPEMSWVQAWDNRDTIDQTEVIQFWFDHRKVVQFYMVDVASNLLNKVWFNSSIKSTPNLEKNRWSMSAGFTGVYEGIAYA